MRLIGWGDDLWAEGWADHGQESDIAYIELLSNMAGNAWSMFHYVALGRGPRFNKARPKLEAAVHGVKNEYVQSSGCDFC